jgi:phage terminase Nu1 subunit (DNA packaging protein)
MPKSKPISFRTYATRRGVSPEAVSKAFDAGRLRKSVVIVDGQPKIADADLADREWAQRTRPRADQGSQRDRSKPDYHAARARREVAAARRERAQARLTEIDLAERRGQLLVAADVEARLVAVFSNCKTKLLGIASRARQREPSFTPSQVDLIDALVRECLEELADRDPT